MSLPALPFLLSLCLLVSGTALVAGERKGPPLDERIDWCATSINARLGGAESTEADLPGRVVLLIQGSALWGFVIIAGRPLGSCQATDVVCPCRSVTELRRPVRSVCAVIVLPVASR